MQRPPPHFDLSLPRPCATHVVLVRGHGVTSLSLPPIDTQTSQYHTPSLFTLARGFAILWDCLNVSLIAKCVLSIVNLFLPLCQLVEREPTNRSTTLNSEAIKQR